MKNINPLNNVLELIPYMDTPLDTTLMDEIRIRIAKHTKYTFITDKYIELLLAHLADANVITITEISIHNTKLTFIRKELNGK